MACKGCFLLSVFVLQSCGAVSNMEIGGGIEGDREIFGIAWCSGESTQLSEKVTWLVLRPVLKLAAWFECFPELWLGRDLTFPSACWCSLIGYTLHYIQYNHIYIYEWSTVARQFECIFRTTKLCLGWSRLCTVVHVVVIWSILNVGPCCRKQRQPDRCFGFGEAGCFLIGALHHRWKWNHDFLGSLRWYQALRSGKHQWWCVKTIWTCTHVGKSGRNKSTAK